MTPYRVGVSEMTEARPGWLSRDDLESSRERLPIVYVDAIPVRVDERGLRRASAQGNCSSLRRL